MANPNKAFLTGTQAVMDWYDRNAKTPFWSVNDSKGDILFYYTGNDENESREHLIDNIKMAEAQGVEATLTCRIHPKVPKGGYFSKSDAGIIVTHFRPSQFNPTYMPMNIGNVGYSNNAILDELRSLKSEIAALKMQQDILENEDEEDESQEENMLGSFMKNPAVQSMIISQLANIFGTQQKVTHVAGVLDDVENEQDEKIDNAIERLKKVDDQLGDDLLLLCEMAENDKMQFNFLLKMLRK